MIGVTVQVYIEKMPAAKVAALRSFTVDELKSLTGFDVVHQHDSFFDIEDGSCDGEIQVKTTDIGPCRVEDCLALWDILADETSPTYAGAAFVREDFIAAILDIVEDVR